MSTVDLRVQKALAKKKSKQQQIDRARNMKSLGYSNAAIAANLGVSESSVRALLKR